MTKLIHKKEKGNNRHWKNYVDKKYLGSHNLEEGEEMILTIVKFEGEEVVQTERGKESNRVLYFQEDVPKMIINMTNGSMLESLYGSHPENWIGKKIQICSAMVKGKGGGTVAGLRIRDFIPQREVDVVASAEILNACKNKEELKTAWESFSTSTKKSPELIALKDTLKTKLQ